MLKQIGKDRKVVIVISLSLLIVSFTQPAFFTANDSSDSLNLSSVGIFFIGWIGFLGGAFESFFWFANPLYIISILLYVRLNKKAIYYSAAASAIAISFTSLKTFIANEGGGRTDITGYGAGFILWVLSFAVLTIGIILTDILKSRVNTNFSN